MGDGSKQASIIFGSFVEQTLLVVECLFGRHYLQTVLVAAVGGRECLVNCPFSPAFSQACFTVSADEIL